MAKKPTLEDAKFLFKTGVDWAMLFERVGRYHHQLRTRQKGCYPSTDDVIRGARSILSNFPTEKVRETLELLNKYSLTDKAKRFGKYWQELRRITGYKPVEL